MSAPTLHEALIEFRQRNGLRADEAAQKTWICKLGPIKLVLPNFAWRRKAIKAHDLHHVLTGYPCTMTGEYQMAAWEFGAGRMPHLAATLFCLPLVVAGLLLIPRLTFQAFIKGRRSLSLHDIGTSAEVMKMPLRTFLAEFTNSKSGDVTLSNYIQFALLILKASFVLLAPGAFLIGLLIMV